ncbi:MAG: cation-transporting P-type ATPase, partial [Treponema sp.]|nr:cation-transporting P-type ATPase [Treponema sp.]
MLWVKESVPEVLQRLDTCRRGLTEGEAAKRLQRFGLNEFEKEKKETVLRKVFHHLGEITAIILLVAAGVAAYMAIFQGDGWAKVIVILSIVVINVFLGIFQESKAEKALDALKKMNAF